MYWYITSQNNKPLHHSVGTPMNPHYMGFSLQLTLMQHDYRLRNNASMATGIIKCCFWLAGKDGRDGVNGDVHFMFLSFSK